MNLLLKPWHLLVLITSASTQLENERKIEMLSDQLRMLLKRHAKRIRLTDEERRVLAVKGKTLGRRALAATGPAGAPRPDDFFASRPRFRPHFSGLPTPTSFFDHTPDIMT